MQDFVAIDFETANSSRGSACEIGLVRFVDGVVDDTFRSYIYQSEFDSMNVMIHGITEADVANAPSMDELWPQIENFIGDSPIVAHNAGFDMSVLVRAMSSGLRGLTYNYYCTMVMARELMELPSYGLDWVTEAVGISYPMNHRALDDAIAAGKLAVELLQMAGSSSFEEAYKQLSKPLRTVAPEDVTVRKHPSLRPEITPEIQELLNKGVSYDDCDYFRGKKIVFTGALLSMDRSSASDIVEKLGADAVDSISKKTNIVVCGYQDPRVLKGQPISSKKKKAIELREAGIDIEILDEKTFLELLSA